MSKISEPNKVSKFIIIAIIILQFILLVYGFFFYVPYQTRKLLTQTYPLLQPGRSVLQSDNLIINIQPLRDKLNSYLNNPDFVVGIYFEYLPTGANISVNKDTELWPASLLKIPIAMAAMKKIEEKQWQLDNELVLLEQDRDPSYGDLYKQTLGTRFTIEKLLYESLVHSDNTAHRILLRNLSEEEIEVVYSHLGFEDLRQDKSPKLTAKRYSILFRSIYTASFLPPFYSQKLLDILIQSPFDQYLQTGMPKTVKFADKFGTQMDLGAFADSGIVYIPNRHYLISVMLESKKLGTKPIEAIHEDAKKLFEEISKSVYEYIINF